MEIEKKILVVEDDDMSATVLKNTLNLAGYKVTIADNGKVALELLEHIFFPLIISDLEMPFVGGKELIAKLANMEIPPIVIVQTAHKEIETIIDVMKLGVSDYLIKPVYIDELLLKVERGFESFRMRQIKVAAEKEKMVRMQEELDWFKWIEENAGKGSASVKSKEQALFYNLKSSIVQGAGFGVIVSLIDLISKSAKKEDKHYLVNADLMEEVLKNNLVAKKIIKSFTDINKILNDEIKLTAVSITDIYEFVKLEIQQLQKYSAIKNHTILIDQPKSRFSSFKAELNMDFFKKLIDEVFINAMKFSPSESKITILLNLEDEKYLNIQVMNPALEDNKKRIGVPLEYENLVFEPFFRMNQFLSSGYDTLDIGIGLTTVKYIAKKHNGEVAISNIKDYRDFSRAKLQVDVKIKIPVFRDSVAEKEDLFSI